MSDTTQPATFHAMTRSERDHLVAVAHLHGESPTGMDVQRRVETLRGGERPSNATTYKALDRLEEWGLVRSVADHPTTADYSLTDAGNALLDAVALSP